MARRGVTIRRINDAGIPFVQEGGAGTYRDDSRSAPYNLFAHLSDTAKSDKQQAVRPADYLPWGDGSDLPQGKKATTLAASFSGGHATEWTYDGEGYTNPNSNAGADDQFPADTVLALQVEVGDAGYLDPAGNHVPGDALRRERSGLALPRRSRHPRDVAQGQADLDAQPRGQGQDHHRARRPRLDGAGPGRAGQRHLAEVERPGGRRG